MLDALLLIALFAFLLGAPAAIMMWEKRLVWPYGEPEVQSTAPDIGSYGSLTVQAAQAAGFSFLGWCKDLKGKNYNLCYAMLVSPDRQTLAIVGSGKLFGMPMAGTWLHTLSGDRQRSWATVDNPSGYERDPLGQTDMRIVQGAFVDVWTGHQVWVHTQQFGTPTTFAAGQELRTFKAFKQAKADLMARTGLIRFIDPLSADRWRYTLSGAVQVAFGGYWHQFRAMVWPKRR